MAHWWGCSIITVSLWRKTLGVKQNNAGAKALRRKLIAGWGDRMRAKIPHQSPERNAKIAAARRGKPRPAHVHEALRNANVGRKATRAARKKMSEAHRKRGTRPPWLNPAWTAEEDEMALTLPTKETAAKTGRSVGAVRERRRQLRRGGR